MKNIAIFGAGGFGREVKMLIDQINGLTPVWNFIGYFDDGLPTGKVINAHPIVGTAADLRQYDQELNVVFAIGDPRVKKKVIESIQSNQWLRFPVLVHPNVYLDRDHVQVGPGTIITANNVITVHIRIGSHVILNLNCTVGHDTALADYCSVMPGVNISGEVDVHEGVFIGTGAKIINQLTVGAWATVGAGAVVSKDVAPETTVVGVPAKPLVR